MLILVNAVVGIIQLIIAVILAVVALYIGFSVFGKVTKNVAAVLKRAGSTVSIISWRES